VPASWASRQISRRHVLLRVHQRGEAAAYGGLVVGDEHLDHAGR
jgi:hypothetical protein